MPALLWMIYQARPDLQARYPIETGDGRAGLAGWLRSSGPAEYGIEPATIDMILGDGSSGESEKAAGPSQAVLKGANLVGYARAELGMGEHVRMSALALEATDCPFGVSNFSVGTNSRQQDGLVDRLFQPFHRYTANIFHINADQMLVAFMNLGLSCFGGRYNVGFWAWELPYCPPQWIPVLAFVDEVWAPSHFIQEAFQRVTSKPVVHMPLCLAPETEPGWSKSDFGLDERAFTFLFTFDSFSYLERKNPAGVITAFRRAFRRGDEPVQLVIKTMNADQEHAGWKQLLRACCGDDRIKILNETFDRRKVLGLTSVCDCYVSLHRSEGFGRGPAEAMYFGKPAIATGYSGNTDYCSVETCCMVGYNLVPVLFGQYPFPTGQVWADPDVDEAVWWMRKLVADPALCRKYGKAGQDYIRRNHGPEVVGKNMADRLRWLGLA